MISSSASSAAARPTSGRDPAPSPEVKTLTQLDAALAERLRQGLGIRIGDDEIDAFQILLDHVVDGVPARAADTDNGDLGLELERSVRHRKV